MTELLWRGERIKRLRLMVPAGGAWLAELYFDKVVDLAEPGTLQIGNTMLTGSIVPEGSATYLTATRARLMGGIGWRKEVVARHFHNDGRITPASVLRATASEVGESMADNVNTLAQLLEVDYVRPKERASRVLETLAPSWWVDFTGVTQVTSRNSAPVSEAVEVKSYDAFAGLAEIRFAEITDVAPNMTILARFSEPKVIRAVEFEFSEVARGVLWLA